MLYSTARGQQGGQGLTGKRLVHQHVSDWSDRHGDGQSVTKRLIRYPPLVCHPLA